MANPSLKAQIEAAKSALASDLAALSSAAPPPEQPTAPIMAGKDIATDAEAESTNAANSTPTNPIPAGANSAHAKDAAALDERIIQLEIKLSNNQRDLHTLLQKIREVSRLQSNFGQSYKNLHKGQAETMPMGEAKDKAVSRHSQRSPMIMVVMATLIGIVVGIAYFLVIGDGYSSELAVPSWISTIVDSVNGWIG
ncbi:hypothetical protein N8Z70_03165 [Candidatus Puniceispirillum sp.]|nr:hypothetical protein [Alphaproteobacteria bacterium]MDC1294023.1 hypothetical protein [Candidatus Puniceispirillum sp.]